MTSDHPTARERALDRLMRIEHEGAFVSRLAGTDTDPDDARAERQSAEYVSGVTRQRRWLDFLIDHFYRGDAEKLEPALRQILRIGLYDLLLLETPPHAAVNEAVELAKRRVRPQAGGLVNGILRAAQRAGRNLPGPDTGSRVTDLAIEHSHPDWIAQRWIERFGKEEAAALLRAANARPVYGLRVNTLRHTRQELTARLDELGVDWEPSPYLDDFLRVDQVQPILRAGLFNEGWCAVQDEAAGLVVRLLDPSPGETVIDAAAAPGGKSVYAALRMENSGRILALDRHSGRLELVTRSAEAHGITIIETRAVDLRTLAQQAGAPRAGRVLLDAPCSGLGVLGKRADLRWQRSEADLAELCALQDALLDAAADLVEESGLLVYSTCTIEPEENEARVQDFLSRNPAFAIEPAHGFIPREMVTDEGYFLALPHRHGTDGAFGIRMRRS